jgi:ketosteroid isomerase-like protein
MSTLISNKLRKDSMNNVEITQAIYQRFGQGDIPGVLELLDANIDWIWYGPKEILCSYWQQRNRRGV